jgi:hypothetical protein
MTAKDLNFHLDNLNFLISAIIFLLAPFMHRIFMPYIISNFKINHFSRIIVVQSQTSNEDEDSEESGGTLKSGTELVDPVNPDPQGVNLYILAGHENMQL